ncbi:MAG TPA: trehalose-phosphatase [Longimicrobiales bacterium]|nr:trehalose-phosphatase [Longimicrobiales bacterium]
MTTSAQQTPPEPPGRPLLLLDYDGTLAPIVDDPAAATPHPSVPDLLSDLASRHPLVVVTGRSLDDLARLLPAEVDAVGLHGAQVGRLGGAIRLQMPASAREALRALRGSAPSIDGLRLEEKGPTFALHYRGATEPDAVEAALRAWVAEAPPTLEPVWGKMVLELRPAGVDKGRVARELAARHADRAPVYIGDDTTDEDAFRALADDPRALTVRVGEGETAARYRLPDVDAVVAWLGRFLTSPRTSS